jgi:hypothetical protein
MLGALASSITSSILVLAIQLRNVLFLDVVAHPHRCGMWCTAQRFSQFGKYSSRCQAHCVIQECRRSTHGKVNPASSTAYNDRQVFRVPWCQPWPWTINYEPTISEYCTYGTVGKTREVVQVYSHTPIPSSPNSAKGKLLHKMKRG